jgi:hypothetical protein
MFKCILHLTSYILLLTSYILHLSPPRLSKYAKVVSKLAKITFKSHFCLVVFNFFFIFALSKMNSDLNICYLGDLNKFSCGT